MKTGRTKVEMCAYCGDFIDPNGKGVVKTERVAVEADVADEAAEAVGDVINNVFCNSEHQKLEEQDRIRHRGLGN